MYFFICDPSVQFFVHLSFALLVSFLLLYIISVNCLFFSFFNFYCYSITVVCLFSPSLPPPQLNPPPSPTPPSPPDFVHVSFIILEKLSEYFAFYLIYAGFFIFTTFNFYVGMPVYIERISFFVISSITKHFVYVKKALLIQELDGQSHFLP